MSRVLDRNGVHLTRGMRVSQSPPVAPLATREGVVAATVGLEGVLVLWDGDQDDEYADARTLTTVDAVREARRRRRG